MGRSGDGPGRGGGAARGRGAGSSSPLPPTPRRGLRRSPARLAAAGTPRSDAPRIATLKRHASNGAGPAPPPLPPRRSRTSASSRSTAPCNGSSPRGRSSHSVRHAACPERVDPGPGVCQFSLKCQWSLRCIGSACEAVDRLELRARSERPALLRGPASSEDAQGTNDNRASGDGRRACATGELGKTGGATTASAPKQAGWAPSPGPRGRPWTGAGVRDPLPFDGDPQ